jgi:Uncharacterized protein conserved in bacteria
VVCGHIHRAELRSEDRQIYANCGDWVESLTALAEDFDGRLKLLHWNAGLQVLAELAPQTATHPAPLHPAHTTRPRMIASAVAPQVAAAAEKPWPPAAGTPPLRILIVTDAWEPQVNGVVRTLKTTIGQLRDMGQVVEVVEPGSFRTIPCPTYPEIRLSLRPRSRIMQRVTEFMPDVVHVATEGPLGQAARRIAQRLDIPLTTAYHTRFPEYVQARFRVPLGLDLCLSAALSQRRPRGAGAHASGAARFAGAWFSQCAAVVARGGSPHVLPARRRTARRHAAHLSVRRPGGGGEEHRRLPAARPAGHQVGGG